MPFLDDPLVTLVTFFKNSLRKLEELFLNSYRFCEEIIHNHQVVALQMHQSDAFKFLLKLSTVFWNSIMLLGYWKIGVWKFVGKRGKLINQDHPTTKPKKHNTVQSFTIQYSPSQLYPVSIMSESNFAWICTQEEKKRTKKCPHICFIKYCLFHSYSE
jgi:hypothetical protein